MSSGLNDKTKHGIWAVLSLIIAIFLILALQWRVLRRHVCHYNFIWDGLQPFPYALMLGWSFCGRQTVRAFKLAHGNVSFF